MRLTSYNIASKILLAKCCMSDLAVKMIEAKAAGNEELISCIREKLIALDAMIFALSKWYPVISPAKLITSDITIESGVFTFPFIAGNTYIGGIIVGNPFTVFSGTNEDVFTAFADSFNDYVSPDDDTVQITASSSGETISLRLVYNPSVTNLALNNPSVAAAVNLVDVTEGPIDYEESPSCLSSERVENILRKIDEICSCGCGEEVISDSISKYLELEP